MPCRGLGRGGCRGPVSGAGAGGPQVLPPHGGGHLDRRPGQGEEAAGLAAHHALHRPGGRDGGRGRRSHPERTGQRLSLLGVCLLTYLYMHTYIHTYFKIPPYNPIYHHSSGVNVFPVR